MGVTVGKSLQRADGPVMPFLTRNPAPLLLLMLKVFQSICRATGVRLIAEIWDPGNGHGKPRPAGITLLLG